MANAVGNTSSHLRIISKMNVPTKLTILLHSIQMEIVNLQHSDHSQVLLKSNHCPPYQRKQLSHIVLYEPRQEILKLPI